MQKTPIKSRPSKIIKLETITKGSSLPPSWNKAAGLLASKGVAISLHAKKVRKEWNR